MAMRNTSSLLTIAVLVGAAYFLLPTAVDESFVAPKTSTLSQAAGAAPSALAQGFEQQPRALRVAAASGLEGPNGQPGKISLVFIGLLVGTAVIGLIALFAYGAYSGSGSSL
uniref:Photosystem II reaction center protein J n=1 Tax=Alexandrium catenella TaxID=2925 RepID=A0A6T9I379_ALECA|mmetsp:Transcript_28252/g.76531  ORF Transcript_28252/g.76531 Transcript_28252/m.76531 type:complete len:112 (+) Transcript_28252:74-409(+)|eukprot:CAMPEP_0171233334 /NCGR_PEP_ID=MMETSP0790-20130122/40866_1 /TAXON_ID=2925 /ORGANISM="Alexandrium catenella, Strain OF101" /LENGTH=111 /DNA_ID=CAMNT_0011699589 /DNA_START=74 /DNA_END=409 /DNA_ORIENTATION=-